MAKFFRLIHNEYIKIFHRISTFIMLGLMVLAALGLNLVALLVQSSMSASRDGYYGDPDTYYNDQIDYLKTAKPEGYQWDIEQYTFMKEMDIDSFHEDWRAQAVFNLYDMKKQDALLQESGAEQKDRERLTSYITDTETAIRSQDWKKFCEATIALNQSDDSLTKEQKEQVIWEYQYRLDHNIPWNSENWKSVLVAKTATLKQEVEDAQAMQQTGQGDVTGLEKQEEQLKIDLYRLEHDIEINAGDSGMTVDYPLNFWSIFTSSTSLLQVVSVLIIVIAGSCVASEFSSGTIKFLLINPVKRGKILASKYVMIVTFSFIMLALFYVANILFTALFFGFGNFGAPYLYISGGEVHSISGFLYMAGQYLLGSVNMIVMATLAFAISSLIRSSALAIGVSLFAMLAGSGAVLFLKEALNIDWARYIVFANTDLNAILSGTTPFANQTIGFALGVIAVYMVVFLLTAWDGFVRREV